MSLLHDVRPFQGLFACAVVFSLLGGCSRTAPAPEPVRAVKLLEVGAQAASHSVEYAGEVRAQTESRLGFQVAGKLLRREVNAGDAVRQGQLLAQLDGQDYALAAQAALAQVAAAQTQRDLAQADWQRYSTLKDQGFISGVELDRRRASLRSAQAQLDQAQAQAAAQNNQSAYTRLQATASGVVTAVLAEPGQVVAAGTPVVQLAHDGPRDVVVAVPEAARSAVQPGQTVQVRLWTDAETWWPGVVREVGASADAATRTYAVKVTVQAPQPPALGATAYVRMAAAQAPAHALITLPSSAVWEQGGGSMVWVFDAQSSTVSPQAVTVAGVQGNAVQVAQGLQSGMQVVATGTHVLSPGQKVSIYQPPHADAAQ